MTTASYLFITVWLLALWYHWRKFGSHISVSSLLFALVILLHGIPLLVYLHITGPDTYIYEAALSGVDREEVQSELLLAMSLMYAFLIVGSELAQLIFPKWHRQGIQEGRARKGMPLYRTYMWTAKSYNMLWVIVVLMLTVSVYQSQLVKVYSYFASGGSEFEKIALRRESGGSSFYLYNVFLYSVAPFLVMVVYSANLNGRIVRGGKFLFLALFTATLLGKLGTLSKAPPVIFLLQMMFFWVLLKRQQFNFSIIAGSIMSVLVLFVVMVSITMPELDLNAVLQFLYYRMFDIPNEALLEFFAAIPASIPHGWGAGLFGFMDWFLDKPALPMYFAVAEVTRGSIESSSNVMFVGDAWAQFSWGGVVIFSLLSGFIVRAIDLYAFRHGHSVESACLVAGCSFGVFTMLSTSLTTALITGGLVLLPLLSALFPKQRTSRIPNRLAPTSSIG